MAQECMIFRFDQAVAMHEVETTLRLARLAAASLHGDDRVHQQAPARVDHAGHKAEIDTTREVGQALALIFGGYVRREFGDDAVHCERLSTLPRPKTTPQEILT